MPDNKQSGFKLIMAMLAGLTAIALLIIVALPDCAEHWTEEAGLHRTCHVASNATPRTHEVKRIVVGMAEGMVIVG